MNFDPQKLIKDIPDDMRGDVAAFRARCPVVSIDGHAYAGAQGRRRRGRRRRTAPARPGVPVIRAWCVILITFNSIGIAAWAMLASY